MKTRDKWRRGPPGVQGYPARCGRRRGRLAAVSGRYQDREESTQQDERTDGRVDHELTDLVLGTTIRKMIISLVRRVIGSWLAVSLAVMALSACTSGPMTMSEMVCCAEHHDECEMAGQGESCCAPDFQSDMGVLAAERSETTHVASVASQIAVTQPHQVDALSTLLASAFVEPLSAHYGARSRPFLLNTVLLI